MQHVDPARPYWILDPIDGTTNLIHDCHQSCVALALWDGEKLVFGCCYNPFREETFVAELGKGAYLNGQPIHVSDMSEMEKALVIVGTSPYEREKTDRVFDMVKRIFQRSADIRRLGSAELDLCWVACGRADCYVEYNLKPWTTPPGASSCTRPGQAVRLRRAGPKAALQQRHLLLQRPAPGRVSGHRPGPCLTYGLKIPNKGGNDCEKIFRRGAGLHPHQGRGHRRELCPRGVRGL